MKRMVSTWPYLAAVAGLAIGWLLIAKLTLGHPDLDGLVGLYIGTVVPLVVAGGGVVLTLKRGYDWVTLLACLALWVVFALLGPLTIGLPLALDATAAATLAYVVIAHVGVVAVLALNRLGRSGPSAGV